MKYERGMTLTCTLVGLPPREGWKRGRSLSAERKEGSSLLFSLIQHRRPGHRIVSACNTQAPNPTILQCRGVHSTSSSKRPSLSTTNSHLDAMLSFSMTWFWLDRQIAAGVKENKSEDNWGPCSRCYWGMSCPPTHHPHLLHHMDEMQAVQCLLCSTAVLEYAGSVQSEHHW
ncbi:hypothetical protein BDW66DRAFT_114881 [Aspergillus desertorum]